MKLRPILIAVVLFFSLPMISIAQDGMTNEKLGNIIKATELPFEGTLGNWQIQVDSQLLFIITDEAANRMRIFTDVIKENELKTGQLRTMLEANFHTALDAKYSIWNGFVISVYNHPLAELQEEQFLDALVQVYVLSATFGTEYTSTGMVFRPDTMGKQPDGAKQN
ncbi:MAG: hypothetical protein AAFV80_22665 [Bacteroidota bacterium]